MLKGMFLFKTILFPMKKILPLFFIPFLPISPNLMGEELQIDQIIKLDGKITVNRTQKGG